MFNIKATARLAFFATFALGGTIAVRAQQPSDHPARKPGDLVAIRKVSTLVGTDVMNHTNSKIATLRDVAFSRDGAAAYAIVGCGGVAGVGESYTALPFDLLGVRNDEGKWAVNLDMTAENLKKAPIIKSENYNELLDPAWIRLVDQFVKVHGESAHHPSRTSDAIEREHRIVDRVLLATKIRAGAFRNPQNQSLGKVEDLVLDQTDRVVFVIIGRGGVLGVGENYIPVPWSKLSLSENRANAAVSVVIDATKAQLEKAPLVKGDNYATLLAPGFPDQVREYFGVAKRHKRYDRDRKNLALTIGVYRFGTCRCGRPAGQLIEKGRGSIPLGPAIALSRSNWRIAMKLVHIIRRALALTAMGIVITSVSGCDSDQTATPVTPNSPTIEPKLSPPKGAVEDLKKDIKPPVVVKPDSAPVTGDAPAPKHE